MVRGFQCYLVGSAVLGVLGVLAGCGGRYLLAEREPWRHEAEVQCLGSGAVREGPGKVRIAPIEGPGACGADFPLKVSSLGNSVPLGYIDDPRPPGAIPNGAGAAPPRWPIAPSRPAAPSVTQENFPALDDDTDEPRPIQPSRRAPPSAPGYGAPPRSEQPLSLDPFGPSGRAGASPEPYDFRKPYGAAWRPPAVQTPATTAPLPSAAGSPYDSASAPYGPRMLPPRSGQPFGPVRALPAMASVGPVGVSPAATLACPLVSALDQWIDEAVQPAALKWFGQPVVEITQISAYSCRGMNGDPNASISEHAFGNALDIAAFTLADGRKVTVQYGWRGAPEEQAFLHDVQAAACDQFTTVLAPGSNAFHYNHMHVDLMRRRSGHHACNPQAISGDAVAARLGFRLAARRAEPEPTGSIGQRRTASPPQQIRSAVRSDRRSDRGLPEAVPGADGEN
jgi:hypothetical protein